MKYYVLLLMAIFGVSAHADEGVKATSWAVYYSDKAALQEFSPYSLLVLDSKYHPPLRPLADRGKTLLGYLSLGEVEQQREHFAAVKAQGLLFGENPVWKGSYYIDVRDRRWTERVVTELIPAILHQGFDGIFLDTLDNPPHLEREDPKQFAGMREAAVRLVRTIRRHYPHIKIMLNRGYELLPEVASDIDMVLGESVYADYDFERQTYQRVPEPLYREQVAILKEAVRRNPALQVFTLDYWDPADKAGIAAIYRAQRANGFYPYVATIALDQVVPEPSS